MVSQAIVTVTDPHLPLFDAARRALAEARSIDEVKTIRDQAEAMRAYVKQQRGSLEMQNEAAEIKIRAERRLGEMLAEIERERGERTDLTSLHDVTKFQEAITDIQIDRMTAHRWQEIARVPEPIFEAFVEDTKEDREELTSAAVRRLGRSNVHFSSESPEWYTPPDIIARTIATLGGIDLDPCSNSAEQPNVPATQHYTVEHNGLSRKWHGRVYMNPPYGAAIDEWVAKLQLEHLLGRTTAAIALVPARTDTGWWNRLISQPVCLVRGRLKFSGHDNSAPFPSAIFYLGPDYAAFHASFRDLGGIWRADLG